MTCCPRSAHEEHGATATAALLKQETRKAPCNSSHLHSSTRVSLPKVSPVPCSPCSFCSRGRGRVRAVFQPPPLLHSTSLPLKQGHCPAHSSPCWEEVEVENNPTTLLENTLTSLWQGGTRHRSQQAEIRRRFRWKLRERR